MKKLEDKFQILYSRVDYLEKLISSIQQNVNFNIGIFIALMTMVTAIVIYSLKYISKSWVEKSVNKEFESILKKNYDKVEAIEARYEDLLNKTLELEKENIRLQEELKNTTAKTDAIMYTSGMGGMF